MGYISLRFSSGNFSYKKQDVSVVIGNGHSLGQCGHFFIYSREGIDGGSWASIDGERRGGANSISGRSGERRSRRRKSIQKGTQGQKEEEEKELLRLWKIIFM